MGLEKKLRDQVRNLTEEIYGLRKQQEKFIPGVTRINYSGRVYNELEMQALVDSSLDFWLTLGPRGKEFEEKFADYLGVEKTIVCNSGSSANLLAVSALCSRQINYPINRSDEIITTALAFPTTLTPILQNNLIPVFVDVELGNYNIDVSKIEEAISPRTRGIMFAHTLGNPANLGALMKIAEKNHLYVIEDTCDALDSKYNGKFVGSFGDISTFSFYAAHHITMGEGGALATNNLNFAKVITSLRDWGRDCFCQTGEKNPAGACRNRFNKKFPNLPEGYDHKYVYSTQGYSLRPLDIQCAVGLEQLKKLPDFTKRRKENFEKLFKTFGKYSDKFILPEWLPESDVSWFSFPLTIRDNAGFSRRDIVSYLESKMIETRMLFGGNILRQPGFETIEKRVVGILENTDKVLNDTFFVGVYPGINDEKMNYISKCVHSFFDK